MHPDAWRLHRDNGCDIRTADRALREGVDRIKGFALRERLLASAKKLGIPMPVSKQERAA